MRIEQLRYFVAVAETASINKASERLYISQQSLNTSLTRLEQELGVQLFQRSSQGVALTSDGYAVLDYAMEVLKKTDDLKHQLTPQAEDILPGVKGKLDLTICPPVSHWVLPKCLKKFHMEYNDVHLSIIENENMEMFQGLLDNSQRLYIMNIYERFDREFELLNLQNLFYRELSTSRSCAVVSEKHPLAKQNTISSSVLRQYPLAIFQASEKTPNSVEEHLRSCGPTKVVFKTNNIVAYQEFLSVGDTIGFMGKCSSKKLFEYRGDLKILPVKDFPLTRIVCLANLSYYNKKKELIELFLEHLVPYLN